VDPVAYFFTLAECVTPLIHFVAAAFDAVHDGSWPGNRRVRKYREESPGSAEQDAG